MPPEADSAPPGADRRLSEEELTVVLRSIGERTTAACERLLERQVPSECIHHVEDLSVPESILRPYEIGVAEDRPWTVVVDADVLPRPDMLETLLEVGRRESESVFAIEARIRDKFYGGDRVAGNTLYRTDRLETALDIGERADDEAGRPETAIIRLMAERGHELRHASPVVAVHDYEQYYADVYRTAHGYVNNHEHYVPILRSYWERHAPDDGDFRVMLAAADRARGSGAKNANYSERFDNDEVRGLLDDIGLSEKDELDPEAVSPDRIERLSTASPPPEFRRCRRLMRITDSQTWSSLPRHLRGVVIVASQIGPARAVPWACGKALAMAGRRIQDIAQGEGDVSV